MKEILYDTDIAQIYFEQENKLLTLVWKRYLVSGEYRDVFSRVLEFIQQKDVQKFLADTRLEGTIHPEDRKWLETDVVPAAVKAGLKYSATILDANVFKKYYLSQIKNTSEKSGMNAFQIFDDYDKGRQWLLDQN